MSSVRMKYTWMALLVCILFLKKPWLTLASIKLFYILMQTLHLTDLSEWASNGRKHNSFLLDIWLQLIIEKDSCLFIDLSSLPYFWALFFLSLSLSHVTNRKNTVFCAEGEYFKHSLNPSLFSFSAISHCFRLFPYYIWIWSCFGPQNPKSGCVWVSQAVWGQTGQG